MLSLREIDTVFLFLCLFIVLLMSIRTTELQASPPIKGFVIKKQDPRKVLVQQYHLYWQSKNYVLATFCKPNRTPQSKTKIYIGWDKRNQRLIDIYAVNCRAA